MFVNLPLLSVDQGTDLFVALTAKTSLRTMKTIYSFFEVSEQIRDRPLICFSWINRFRINVARYLP